MGFRSRILCVAGLLAGACQTIPDYPLSPVISFNSVRFEEYRQRPFGGTIFLNIDYKDGDGDLGLSAADIQNPPFTEFLDSAGVQIPNPDRFNIFPQLLKKEGENYVPISVVGAGLGTFPRLREGDSRGPISGTILYKIESSNFFNQDSTIAKIRVYIQDRSLNRSNVLETPPFPVIDR